MSEQPSSAAGNIPAWSSGTEPSMRQRILRPALTIVLANARLHPARMCLTTLAMIASACVVVWVVSGYDAMVSQFGGMASEYLGRYDLFVTPEGREARGIAPDLIAALRSEPSVAEVEPAWQLRARVTKAGAAGPKGAMRSESPGEARPGGAGGRFGRGPGAGLEREQGMSPEGRPDGPGSRRGGLGSGPGGGPPSEASPQRVDTLTGPVGSTLPIRRRGMGPMLVGTDASQSPYPLAEGTWIDFRHPTTKTGVLSKGAAESLEVTLGDEVLVIAGPKETSVKIVGICEQAPSGASMSGGMRRGAPSGPAAAALYVSMFLAGELTAETPQVNLVSIKLKTGIDPVQFRLDWEARLATTQAPVSMRGLEDIKSGMEEGMSASSAKKQAWAATGMSLLAALFIIFTTLSMGVNERVRQFAVMRAVGWTRFQIACLIGVEGLVLALLGWAGGLAAGWGLLAVVSWAKPELFAQGASLGPWCILLSGLSAFGGAMAASILPAWQATGVQPLEAMSPRRPVQPRLAATMTAAVLGLAMIAVNPVMVYVAPIGDAFRYGVYGALGYACMAIGFLLLAPLAIVAAEAVFAPAIARLVGLDRRLLASQLSSNLWRTLGTTVALTVGLGLYVAMQVWGYSMLQPFLPGDWAPDMLISFQSGGLPDSEIEAVRHAKGIIPEQCIPLAVEQPRLAEDITGSQQRMSKIRGDNVVMIGLDPETAFGGPKPLLGVTFLQGKPDEVIARLKEGRHCVVPDFFIRTTGLGIGDRFAVVPPESPDKRVEYMIAGVVSLPGAHYMTKFSGLRRRSGGMGGLIFAPFETVRRDFDLKEINFFWMKFDKGVDIEEIGKALQPIADRHLGRRQPVNEQGTWSHRARLFGPSLRITLSEDLRANLYMRADLVIWSLSQLPLITLLVTSLGVVNTVMASVRARRWELGVLRALGVTRLGLFRMILAEGLLIGLVACLLSFAFGVMAGWCGTGISQFVSVFGGLNPPLVIPWWPLTLGFGATLLLCLAAALWPAIATGHAEPLRLLQAGRASM